VFDLKANVAGFTLDNGAEFSGRWLRLEDERESVIDLL
jgi:hypothetical protein